MRFPRRSSCAKSGPCTKIAAVIDIGANLGTSIPSRLRRTYYAARVRQESRRSSPRGRASRKATRCASSRGPPSGSRRARPIPPRGPSASREDFSSGSLDALRALARRPEVRAIGECGLDFDRNFSPRTLSSVVSRRSSNSRRSCVCGFSARTLGCGRVHGDPRSLPSAGAASSIASRRGRRALPISICTILELTGWICDERRGTHLVDLVRRHPARSHHDRDGRAIYLFRAHSLVRSARATVEMSPGFCPGFSRPSRRRGRVRRGACLRNGCNDDGVFGLESTSS